MTRAARSPATGTGTITLLGETGGLGDDVARVLRARGLAVEQADERIEVAVARGGHVAAALAEPPDPATAAAIAPGCRAAAEAGRPVVLLAPVGKAGGKAALDRAAALAHLRAHGAILVADPDAWIEAIVLVARFGLPSGPRTAVIAPPGGWLAASARAQASEVDPTGDRGPSIAAVAADVEPADVVLVDPRADLVRASRALVVPVIARGELLAGDDVLVGLRASLAAVASCGRAAERLAAGLGPAPVTARAELEIDHDRVARQLGRLASSDRRIGDHEAKVLLAAYGVPVIRQAVATTPSAATRLAKKAGFPVELKPWGPDVPSERAGCPVERGLATASDVRRAFLAVLGAAGLPVAESGGSVIVRETPPSGREVSASILRVGALGWTVVVEVANQPPIAAPAPLRLVDAAALAHAVTASRAGDPEPDRVALANLLRRASHLAVDQEARIERLELGRIVVAPKGAKTVVVDAEILLR